LACAQRAFDLLTVPPRPLLFDGRGLPGLPQRLLGLRELKAFLIADTTPLWVRDAAWRDLVNRTRSGGPAWVIAAVGVAIPGLRRVAGMLSVGRPGDNADTDADLLEGFLQRLRTIDCDGERICGRLIDAGVRAVRRSRAQREANNVTLVDAAWSLPPAQPFDHPDWVLVRAVAAAVIAPEEQQLDDGQVMLLVDGQFAPDERTREFRIRGPEGIEFFEDLGAPDHALSPNTGRGPRRS
jgi:hypothetical protein